MPSDKKSNAEDPQRKLSVHHIGGRAGTRTFPLFEKFERDIVNVIYDADVDCIEQIEQRNQDLDSSMHVLPYCVGGECGSATFNINYDPYTSSLLDKNPDYNSYYYFTGFDYLIEEVCKPVEKRPVEVVNLDHIFQAGDIAAVPPDFLSIDTQGSEYEILNGGVDTLDQSVLAIVLEVSFRPVYKDQKLFYDIGNFLDGRGFTFARFIDEQPITFAPFRAPIGLRGKAFHVTCDALYLKSIDSICQPQEIESNPTAVYDKLQKLAFISIVFDHFEYGLQCMQKAKSLSEEHSLDPEREKTSFQVFLAELDEQIEKIPHVLPQTFASMISWEKSKGRFDAFRPDASVYTSSAIKQWIKKSLPALFAILKGVNGWLWKNKLKVGLLRAMFKTARLNWTFAIMYRFSADSPVEALLARYGLKNQADLLKRNRWKQRLFTREFENGR